MKLFTEVFGAEPQGTYAAPGRVNLIGEHTDYNGGFVLPSAIPQKTRVALRRRTDRIARVYSANLGKLAQYELGRETRSGDWADYVRAVTHVLGRSGRFIDGFDAWIASDVPIGSGLSSSAALEVSLLRALRAVYGLELDDVEIARLGQRAENEFVGARVGIMDQMASSLCSEGEALFLDTRSLAFRRVPLPAESIRLIVINSGISHRNADGGYNLRRRECEKASELLGVGQLRDISMDDLSRLDELPETIRRRARHVVTENQRVLDAVAALETGDFRRLGGLFRESHRSMRDDYEVSVPEIDRLVEIAAAEEGVYGARLTGGGFGGSIVAICEPALAGRAALRIAQAYSSEFGRSPPVLVPSTHAA